MTMMPGFKRPPMPDDLQKLMARWQRPIPAPETIPRHVRIAIAAVFEELERDDYLLDLEADWIAAGKPGQHFWLYYCVIYQWLWSYEMWKIRNHPDEAVKKKPAGPKAVE
jgi:hypothetical protein